MEKKYQIFISSTYEDLKEERKKIQDAILSMYQIPVGMEMFSAADEEQWEIIRRTIDSSDYYVLIIGHRYGSVIKEGEYAGISYTQKEFRYALERKIPVLAFLIDNRVAVTLEKTEQDADRKEKLGRFIEEVKTGRMVQWWTNKDDLARKVSIALISEINRGRRPGWVRRENIERGSAESKVVRLNQAGKEIDENKQTFQKDMIALNNMSKQIRVLHISDIHFNYKNFKSEVLRNRLLRYIDENDIKADAIIVTGDCVYQYGMTEECEIFLEKLKKKTNCENSNVFLCPGNHDVDRNNSKRNSNIDYVRKERIDITAEVYQDLVANGYDRFCSLYKEVTGRKYKGFEVIEIIIKKNKYRIISINTCLLSKDNYDKGQLRVCCNELESLSSKICDDDCINILIMHHGIEYFQEDDAVQFQHWLDDNYIDIVMCGHSHRGGMQVLVETKSEIRQFVCGATMLDNYAIPSFLVYDFNVKEFSANIKLYTYEYDEWGVGNRHLRAFKSGEYKYRFCRLDKLNKKET